MTKVKVTSGIEHMLFKVMEVISSTYYYRDNFYTDYVEANYIRVRGNHWFFWYYQEGWGAYLNRYFASYGRRRLH